MSSVHPAERLLESEHPVLMRTFDEPTRRSLLEEDASAWRTVCSELITIVMAGLLIGILAVLLAM